MINVWDNGKVREATAEEIAFLQSQAVEIPYKERVIARIRAVYSVDDEIAIIRQKETKPLEFQEYNSFVEKVKTEERER